MRYRQAAATDLLFLFESVKEDERNAPFRSIFYRKLTVRNRPPVAVLPLEILVATFDPKRPLASFRRARWLADQA